MEDEIERFTRFRNELAQFKSRASLVQEVDEAFRAWEQRPDRTLAELARLSLETLRHVNNSYPR
ncbi:hypothetical protein [Medusavirus stheno T3]|uniref:Uncharacterized protein n=1 Tax=Medusavirus stheno T3 TaxID=3069717 RepID=A0A7S7YEL0_9VIRU|nr:hypothetical protein QKU73_gp149 [Acanthamoeba castellanii medusavirus]QPB44330.1 hypothetical protein [Medusavirus stheno T3]